MCDGCHFGAAAAATDDACRRCWGGGTEGGGGGVASKTDGSGERAALVIELFGDGAVPSNVDGRLLRTREVALLFQVSERAVTDWARKGRVPSVRTPGGHRRYPAVQIRALLLDAGKGIDGTNGATG
jgi:excisionase family DNA binding protein